MFLYKIIRGKSYSEIEKKVNQILGIVNSRNGQVTILEGAHGIGEGTGASLVQTIVIESTDTSVYSEILNEKNVAPAREETHDNSYFG